MLVKALKANGHTVAMTGDGVNDVLALKESDCSIAMASGSDAAKNVSSLVLLDSNFASMPKVVAEGRRSINNLERSASLFLVKTGYNLLIALLFLIVPSILPFEPRHLTLLGGVTIGIPSGILALEPNKTGWKAGFAKSHYECGARHSNRNGGYYRNRNHNADDTHGAFSGRTARAVFPCDRVCGIPVRVQIVLAVQPVARGAFRGRNRASGAVLLRASVVYRHTVVLRSVPRNNARNVESACGGMVDTRRCICGDVGA